MYASTRATPDRRPDLILSGTGGYVAARNRSHTAGARPPQLLSRRNAQADVQAFNQEAGSLSYNRRAMARHQVVSRVLALLLAVVSATGCGVRVSAGVLGDDVNGREVEQSIVTGLVPFIRSLDPSLSIGPAKCPSRIDVSNGKVGYCTLIVNGVPLRIHVLYNGDSPPQGYRANFDGSVYLRRENDDFVEKNLLSMYGLHANAHCNMPVIEVFKPNHTIVCAVSGTRFSTVKIRTLSAQGDLYFYPPVSAKPLFPELDTAVRKHRAKQPVMLSGILLQRYVDHWVATEGFAKTSFTPMIGHATCPATANLSGNRYAICTVPFDGENVRYKLSFDDTVGMKVNVLDAVIGRARLEQYAQQLLDQQLQADGDTPDAAVHCGSGNLIVTPAPGKFYCRISANGQSGKLLVNVQDADGAINFGGVEMDNQASPSPSASLSSSALPSPLASESPSPAHRIR